MPKITLENKTIVVVDGIRHHLEQGEQEVSEEIAKELGIETMTPEELERMNASWQRK